MGKYSLAMILVAIISFGVGYFYPLKKLTPTETKNLNEYRALPPHIKAALGPLPLKGVSFDAEIVNGAGSDLVRKLQAAGAYSSNKDDAELRITQCHKEDWNAVFDAITIRNQSGGIIGLIQISGSDDSEIYTATNNFIKAYGISKASKIIEDSKASPSKHK